jgi:predicted transcriptional regulator
MRLAAGRERSQLRAVPTAEQIRAARGLLGWSSAELARQAHVSPTTIVRCERGSGIPRVRMETLETVQRVLETAGVEFITGGNGPGVRLRLR